MAALRASTELRGRLNDTETASGNEAMLPLKLSP
jgi:hypothetical protein